MFPETMLDILQQVSSHYFSSWSSSILGVPHMVTPTRCECDMADHQFLKQEAIPHGV